MSQVSQHQSAQSSVVSNANNIPAGGISLPAVPVFQFVGNEKEDLLLPVIQGKFGPFATAFGPASLTDLIEPEKVKRNPVSPETLKKVDAFKQFADSIKKQMGGDDVIWEGVALAVKNDALLWQSLPNIFSGNVEAEAKLFMKRVNDNNGANQDMGNITLKKEYNSKELTGSFIDEAVALYAPGSSFFGNVYIKKYELNMVQADPASPPKPERVLADHFEFTVQCAHNSFVIKDEQHPANPVLVKTSAEAAAAMRNHIEKNYGQLKLSAEKPELQMLMEFNIPKVAQGVIGKKLGI